MDRIKMFLVRRVLWFCAGDMIAAASNVFHSCREVDGKMVVDAKDMETLRVALVKFRYLETGRRLHP